MSEERKHAEELLDLLLANGLILDTERELAVSFLENYGKVGTMAYVEHYSLENEKGELRFGYGVTFSMLERDMLFDEELRWHLLNGLVYIRQMFQNQVHRAVIGYLEEHPEFHGILSGSGIDYLQWKEVKLLSLDILLNDYNYFLPSRVKEQIAAEYGLTPELFASYMRGFCYTYALAEGSRKLVDIRLADKLPPLFGEMDRALRWNYRRTMMGNIILLHDHLVTITEHEEAAWLEKEVRASLSRYGIKPERIGFTAYREEPSSISIEDSVFLGRPDAAL